MKMYKSNNPRQLACYDVHHGAYDDVKLINIPIEPNETIVAEYYPVTGAGDMFIVCAFLTGDYGEQDKHLVVYANEIKDENIIYEKCIQNPNSKS